MEDEADEDYDYDDADPEEDYYLTGGSGTGWGRRMG